MGLLDGQAWEREFETGEKLKTYNRYVKIKGHKNWFLVLDKNSIIADDFSETMQEKIFRSEVCELHNPNSKNEFDLIHRIKIAATRDLDYKRLVDKYDTILVRPIGSFTLLRGSEITDEIFDTDFPIEEFGEIVVCENDRIAEYKWIEYLQNRFPNSKIVTINYFDLRSETEIRKYFEKANYITFSTTFSNYEWFKKLSRNANNNHKIIGYCHTKDNWENAIKINSNVEIVDQIV